MKLVYAPRALQDIDEILARIAQQSAQGARHVSLAIEHTITVCAASPRGGSLTDEPHLYRWPLRAYRYTIFYRFDPAHEVVEIVRVVQSARIRNLGRLPDES